VSFLEFAFKSDPSIQSAVQQQQFWLITPKSWDSSSWYIVQGGDWKSIARPGAQLGMSFVTLRRLKADKRYRKLIMPDKTDKLKEIDSDDNDTIGSDFTIKYEGADEKEVEKLEAGVAPPVAIDEAIASLRFDKPMPPWAPYNPETSFELL
jgi:hypothetical protein